MLFKIFIDYSDFLISFPFILCNIVNDTSNEVNTVGIP